MLQINALDKMKLYSEILMTIYPRLQCAPSRILKENSSNFYCNLMKKHLDLWGKELMNYRSETEFMDSLWTFTLTVKVHVYQIAHEDKFMENNQELCSY